MSKAIENIIQAVATISQNAAHLQNTLSQLRANKSAAGQAAQIAALEIELTDHIIALNNANKRVSELEARLKDTEGKLAQMDALYLKAAQIATDAQRRADHAEKALKYAMHSRRTTTGDVYGSGAGELADQDAGITVTYSDTQK